MAKAKKEYESFKTFYEGESGEPWVGWLKSQETDGWRLELADVVKRIDDKNFRAKVVFVREVKGAE